MIESLHNPAGRRWSAWVAANAAAELLGLGVVFAAGFAAYRLFGEPTTAGGLLVSTVLAALLGAWEGAVVGAAQWLVLRRIFRRLPPMAWIRATVLGAVAAWLLGMIPSTIASLQAAPATPPPEPGPLLQAVLAAALGAVAGVILSLPQWWALRRHAAGAGWWPLANAVAWAAAMPGIFQLVGSTIAERQSPGAVLLFLLGLGAAGAVVGAVHGAFLVTLLRPR